MSITRQQSAPTATQESKAGMLAPINGIRTMLQDQEVPSGPHDINNLVIHNKPNFKYSAGSEIVGVIQSGAPHSEDAQGDEDRVIDEDDEGAGDDEVASLREQIASLTAESKRLVAEEKRHDQQVAEIAKLKADLEVKRETVTARDVTIESLRKSTPSCLSLAAVAATRTFTRNGWRTARMISVWLPQPSQTWFTCDACSPGQGHQL